MPAGFYPLAFAQHEDFCDAAGLVSALAAGFEFVRVVRVNHSGETLNLNFGFGKLAGWELFVASFLGFSPRLYADTCSAGSLRSGQH